MPKNLNIVRCTSEQFQFHDPKVGEVVLIKDCSDDPGRLVMWSGTEWQDIRADANSEITMTAYDMNKQIIHQLSALAENIINEKKQLITNYCDKTNNKYYMLLCKDTSYYTLCYRIPDGLDPIADVIIECARTQGVIKSIEMTEDNAAIEIWVDNPYVEDGTYVMYFFAYDKGVELCH